MTAHSASVSIQFDEWIAPRASRWRSAGRLAREYPVGVVALLILILLVLAALAANWIAPYGKTELATGQSLQGPNATNLLGTDRLGRDILSRMIYGSRVSLYVGFAAVGLGTVIGSAVGLVSGFVGGWFDLVVQRVMDVLMSIPAILLAMVVVAAFGTGTSNAMYAIALVFIPSTARVVRSATLSLKARQFVEAAEASGASRSRIILRHVLPIAMDDIMVLASVGLAAAIIIEAALSFLGLGVQPPNPSWGGMLADGRANYSTAPHMVYVPAAFISVTVLAITILGDSIRDILDPKVRGSSRANLN
jgi:ABC-type dipeptide/oligopeptide/nickel transport system permease subunit